MLDILISISFFFGCLAFLAYLLSPDRFRRRRIDWYTALSPAVFSGLAVDCVHGGHPVFAWCLEGFSLFLIVGMSVQFFRHLDPEKQERNRAKVLSVENPFSPVVMWVIILIVFVAMEVFWIRAARQLAWWSYLLLSLPALLSAVQVAIHLRDSRGEAKSNRGAAVDDGGRP